MSIVIRSLLLAVCVSACGPESVHSPTPTRLRSGELVLAKAIYSSKYSGCAITEAGGLQCWGIGGQPAPIRVPAPVTAVAMGPAHACAVAGADEVWCWGDRAAPRPVVGISGKPVALAVSQVHACALLGDGSVACWTGLPGSGVAQLPAVAAMAAGSGAVEIAAGSVDDKPSTCARLSTGKVQCWGDNTDGRLGTGSPEETVERPAEVLGLPPAMGVRINGGKRCVLDSTGSVWGWGGWSSPSGGERGGSVNGAEAGQPTQLVAPRSGRTEMTMGPSHACIVSSGGRGECWGNNRSGQLGTWAESNSDESAPVEVKGINVAAIAAGDDHTCVLTRTGTIVCFGDGGGGLGPTPRLIELRQP